MVRRGRVLLYFTAGCRPAPVNGYLNVFANLPLLRFEALNVFVPVGMTLSNEPERRREDWTRELLMVTGSLVGPNCCLIQHDSDNSGTLCQTLDNLSAHPTVNS